MRFRAFAVLFFAFIFSCKAKNSPADVENTLKSTMQAYLYSSINNDSSNAKYRVLDVIYFEEKTRYICQFTVNLKVKSKSLDTTGIMKANITKDLKKVDRIQ
jgi:hypothetical protein